MFTVKASHESFKSNLIFRKSDINSCEITNNSDHCIDKISKSEGKDTYKNGYY